MTFREPARIRSARYVSVHRLLSNIVVTYVPHCNTYVLFQIFSNLNASSLRTLEWKQETERLVRVQPIP